MRPLAAQQPPGHLHPGFPRLQSSLLILLFCRWSQHTQRPSSPLLPDTGEFLSEPRQQSNAERTFWLIKNNSNIYFPWSVFLLLQPTLRVTFLAAGSHSRSLFKACGQLWPSMFLPPRGALPKYFPKLCVCWGACSSQASLGTTRDSGLVLNLAPWICEMTPMMTVPCARKNSLFISPVFSKDLSWPGYLSFQKLIFSTTFPFTDQVPTHSNLLRTIKYSPN